MVTQEQKNRYKFQQTKAGKETLEMLDFMKREYCNKLGIPFSNIKIGKLRPLINEFSGQIERFIEE